MSTFLSLILRGVRADQPIASTVPVATLYYVTDEGVLERSSGSAWESYSASAASGKLVQVVNTQTGALATGGTVIPFDDSIPQNTEGNEFMTLSITPTDAANKLKIDIVFFGTSDGINWITVALFQDSTAGALAAFANYNSTPGGGVNSVFTHYMTAGTVAATTFKVRAGRDASAGATITFNGVLSGRFLGGVMASSITISEIVP
jgi:hypothetical protein